MTGQFTTEAGEGVTIDSANVEKVVPFTCKDKTEGAAVYLKSPVNGARRIAVTQSPATVQDKLRMRPGASTAAPTPVEENEPATED